MSTLKSVGNKLFKTELATHEVELGLVDDIKKQSDLVNKQIGFLNTDIIDVKKSLSLIEKIKSDFNSVDKLGNDLLNSVISFEKKAMDLGIDVPNEIINSGNTARQLLKTNDELKKLINK